MRKLRKTPPEVVRVLLDLTATLKSGDQLPVDEAVDAIRNQVTASSSRRLTKAEDLLLHLVKDGLLKVGPKATSSTNQLSTLDNVERMLYSGPQEIPDLVFDLYCYECHKPGKVLKCEYCWRSFHRQCGRVDAEIPNWTESLIARKSKKPSNDIDKYLQRSVTQAQVHTPGGPENVLEDSLFDVEVEDIQRDFKVDVECLGETRPPMRQRPNTTTSTISWKSEIVEESPRDENTCTCCRLMKRAALDNPPLMAPDELCYLLGFIINYAHSWIDNDARSKLSGLAIPSAVKKAVTRFLFRKDGATMRSIRSKIMEERYTYLAEFMVDVLDIHHEVGVFYGSDHLQYGYSKCMVSDINNMVADLRRCPDCFRHSHERQSIYWFAKPCVQRHELVYAKVKGYDYWPAKVMRALGSDDTYEVRFFGGDHDKGQVRGQFMKSIDTDPKLLKMSKGIKMQRALEELRWHQILSVNPPSIFAYKADPCITDQTIELALEGLITGPLNVRQTELLTHSVLREEQASAVTPQVAGVQRTNRRSTPAAVGGRASARKRTAAVPESGQGPVGKRARPHEQDSSINDTSTIVSVGSEATPRPPPSQRYSLRTPTIAPAVAANLKKLEEQLARATESLKKKDLLIANLRKQVKALKDSDRRTASVKGEQYCPDCRKKTPSRTKR